jgi:hypothetical protein
VEALGQAKKIISQLATKGSFLQKRQAVADKIKAHGEKIQALIGDAKRPYMSLIVMLLEAATDQNVQADRKLVSSVIQIIDELVDSLHGMMKIEMKADE